MHVFGLCHISELNEYKSVKINFKVMYVYSNRNTLVTNNTKKPVLTHRPEVIKTTATAYLKQNKYYLLFYI